MLKNDKKHCLKGLSLIDDQICKIHENSVTDASRLYN